MTKNSVVCCTYIGIGIFAVLFPMHTYAAQVFFRVVPPTAFGDTATIVEVYVDPEGVPINAIEGIISLQHSERATVPSVRIETGGSVFSLWPKAPQFDEESGVIRFTGGIPAGFDHEELLMRIRFFATTPGTAILSWIGGAAYRNDGMGTQENISSRSITISLPQSALNHADIASADSKPPVFDSLETGHDESVYDGKYFISFHATDDVSGIEKYEVIENDVQTETRDGTYVFIDQEKKTPIIITAYDKAGNSTSIKIPWISPWIYTFIILSGIGVVVLLTYILLRYRRICRMKLSRR